ncbi:MAG TPA: hypothetical protein VFN25_03740 [Dokdonella sp.]|uniref:hypothetical protein n=1 Tax=Dokdonella sp. TaxID=2291710 RepID=UPI002D7E2E47|nr:hypothetical protein [Dokdonella sp.]HET9031999.1 hypothetical protein [Dokdonella sp.]
MLDDFIVVTEVAEGPAFAESVFQRKFKLSVPDFPHHIVTFYRQTWNCFVPMSYLHVRPWGDFHLVGGGCTDGRVFEMMTGAQREEVNQAGGLLLGALRYSFARFADRCEAYFGYCGDPRAYEIDMQAGFVPTQHERLIARWHKPLTPERKLELIAEAHKLIPF